MTTQTSLLQKTARYFDFNHLHTNWRTEILAGFTTFITMAYILVVNPAILSNGIFLNESGDLFGELAIATALSAALATVIMGFYAKLPFGLAPGMGINAYFTFAVVLGLAHLLFTSHSSTGRRTDFMRFKIQKIDKLRLHRSTRQ